MARDFASQAQWGADLREAIDRGELRLFAQPVVAADGERVEQHELLVRLNQPRGSLMPPAAFFPMAERFGLLERVDRWVLEQACDLIAAADGPPPQFEINVSGRSMADPAYTDLVHDQIAQKAIDPRCLIFEINETHGDHDRGALAYFARRLRALGCRFALDNFGSAQGSLVSLKELPLDFLKIDARLTRHVATTRNDQLVVGAVAGLCTDLGMSSVGTGVADQETVDALRELGVDLVQGFHLGTPAPAG